MFVGGPVGAEPVGPGLGTIAAPADAGSATSPATRPSAATAHVSGRVRTADRFGPLRVGLVVFSIML
jgi:hypothetical protein